MLGYMRLGGGHEKVGKHVLSVLASASAGRNRSEGGKTSVVSSTHEVEKENGIAECQ